MRPGPTPRCLIPIVLRLGLLLALLAIQPRWAMAERDAGDPAYLPQRPERIEPENMPYAVRFDGVPEAALLALLENVSDTAKARGNPPATTAQLERRARDDLDNLLRAAHSMGYFRARMTPLVQADRRPALVVFDMQAGPRFALGDVILSYPDGPPLKDISTFRDLGLRRDSGFEAQAVLEAEKRIPRLLGDQGYPTAQVVDRKVTADFAANRVEVRWAVLPGPLATFGSLELNPESRTEVSADYIRSQMPWETGEPYSRKDEDDARQVLLDTGLFSMAEFLPHKAEDLDADGGLPMRLTVRDRAPRNFRIGGSYATDLGPGASVSWRHRNLQGGGELLSTALDVNNIYKTLEATYREPQFLADRQALRLTAKLSDERPEGFTSQSAETAAVLEHKIGRYSTAGGGLGLKLLNVKDDPLQGDRVFGLAFVPLFAGRDTRDDILDPTRGYVLRLDAAPYYDFLNGNQFNAFNLTGSAYIQMLDRKRLILALRARFGEVFGVELADLPAPERFYAGGGGSVRGYEYKTLSDLQDNNPEGGRSIIESSAELRVRFLRDWGLVAFVDGGRAYRDSLPNMSQRFFLGVGTGLRYYTDFGPIRVDVAFPLNRREDFDPRFQVYASIGQSF